MRLLEAAPPSGGHCLVDMGLLLGTVRAECILLKDVYSDDLAAAVVMPRVFKALADAKAPMRKRYGIALYLLGMKSWQMGFDNRDPEMLAPLLSYAVK